MVIGVSDVFTAPVTEDTDVLKAGLVTKVDEVTDGLAPAAFVAVTDATYCVPG